MCAIPTNPRRPSVCTASRLAHAAIPVPLLAGSGFGGSGSDPLLQQIKVGYWSTTATNYDGMLYFRAAVAHPPRCLLHGGIVSPNEASVLLDEALQETHANGKYCYKLTSLIMMS